MFKKVLFIFLCLLVAVCILPFVINLNYFKPQIQQFVYNNSNKKINFSDLNVTIVSGLGIQLQNFSIDLADAKFPHGVTAGSVNVKFDLWPLLQGYFTSVGVKSITIKNMSMDYKDIVVFNIKNLDLDIFQPRPQYFLGTFSAKHVTQSSPVFSSIIDVSGNFSTQGATQTELLSTLNVHGKYALSNSRLYVKDVVNLATQQLQKYVGGLGLTLPAVNVGKNNIINLKNSSGKFEVENSKVLINTGLKSDQETIKCNVSIGFNKSLGGNVVYTSKILELNILLGGTLENPMLAFEGKSLQDNFVKQGIDQLKDTVGKELKKNNLDLKKLEDAAKKLLQSQGLDFKNLF